jgi:ribonuclease-3
MGLQQIVFQQLRDEHFKNILGNAFEAIIGAIYLDAGYKKVKSYIANQVVKPYLDFKLYENYIFDYKSHLIEWSQKNDMELTFEDIEKETRNLNQPVFLSKVKVFDKILGSGIGNSKKEAQQEAARQAFDMYIES